MPLLPESWLPEMLFIDIDGTITDANRILIPEAITALKKLEDAGVMVGIATGNVRPIAWNLAKMIGLSGPVIAENGGVVWIPDLNKIEVFGNGDRAKDAAYWLGEQISNLDSNGIESNEWRESEWCLKSKENIDEIKNKLLESEWKDLEVVKTGYAIHIAESGLNKGRGILKVCEWLKISPANVCSIGDAPNDVPMFNTCGWSVAVGGASDEAKESANMVSEKIRGFAVVELCEEWIARKS